MGCSMKKSKRKGWSAMSMPNDPIMLLSVVNTMLRDRYHNLDALCDGEELMRGSLEERLAAVGYRYIPENNQFR